MKNKNIFQLNINKSLLHLLLKYFPTNEKEETLLDIINILMDGLSRGAVYNKLIQNPTHVEIQSPGWPETHKKALVSSGWSEGKNSPIVIIDNQIAWRRYHTEMNQCIKDLLDRAKAKYKSKNNKKTISDLNFSKNLNNQQLKAVELINLERLILLSGGPGTGKTSTILQMLLNAFSLQPNILIGLAAPTGKATKRLQETIQKGIESLSPSLQQELTHIPCKTLHKWLDANPSGFKKNKNNLLNIDLLVIDEMSMVDLNLFQALLDALPKNSQLILVGDPDQLPPVGIGPIWHELLAERVQRCINKNSIHLDKVYRNQGDLAFLSKTIKEKGLDLFWEKLSLIPDSSNIRRHISSLSKIQGELYEMLRKNQNDLKKLSRETINSLPIEAWSSSSFEFTPTVQVKELFNKLDNVIVLCPQKSGHGGINSINKALLGAEAENGVFNWEEGTPVICGSNQEDLGLANGDIGLIIKEGKKVRLLFNLLSEKQDLVARLIHPARVKTLSPAFAVTIHKSQGSEADHVILIWPYSSFKADSLVNQKENDEEFQRKLIYTAITRAKKRLDIFIDLDFALV